MLFNIELMSTIFSYSYFLNNFFVYNYLHTNVYTFVTGVSYSRIIEFKSYDSLSFSYHRISEYILKYYCACNRYDHVGNKSISIKLYIWYLYVQDDVFYG